MSRILGKTLGAVVGIGIALSAGCERGGQSSIFVPLESCSEVPVCGTVCYEELESGQRLITLNGQEKTKSKLKEYCRLDRVCEIDEEGGAYDGLRLWQ